MQNDNLTRATSLIRELCTNASENWLWHGHSVHFAWGQGQSKGTGDSCPPASSDDVKSPMKFRYQQKIYIWKLVDTTF